MKSTLKLIAFCLISGFAGAAAYDFAKKHFEELNPVSNAYANQGSIQAPPIASGGGAVNEDFVMASAVASPTVVFIKTSSAQTNQNYFDWFFNWGQGKRASGSGSGVIYSTDGYIITNNHVIENADNIEIIHQKRSYKAKVIGTDPSTDLAVLKIEGKSLPAVKFGDSRKVRIGEWVIAVGNPFNLNSTVTAGIVSAKGRNLNIMNSQFPIESFIQTDAAINPGNSGGALVNLRGELIGINSAIYSQTGSYTGYAFAVPSDIVAKVVNDLIKYGEVQKVFLGAEITDLNIQDADKEANTSGVWVASVTADGAAEKAGLKKGDVILKVSETPVNSKANFDEELSFYNPGDKIKIVYLRGKDLKETFITLTNREGTTGILKREIFSSQSLGAELEVVSKVERERLGIEGGVRVVKFTANGILRQMGFDSDYVITSVNYKNVKTPQDLEELLKTRGKTMVEAITPQRQKVMYSFWLGGAN